jgi:hypothetical protein
MTDNEAHKMAILFMTADLGCPHCGGALCEKAAVIWPEHKGIFNRYDKMEMPDAVYGDDGWEERCAAVDLEETKS